MQQFNASIPQTAQYDAIGQMKMSISNGNNGKQDFVSDIKALQSLVQNERMDSECNQFSQYDPQLGELKFVNRANKMSSINNSNSSSRPPSNDTSQANNQSSLESMYMIQMKPIESAIKEEKQSDCVKKEIKAEKSSLEGSNDRVLEPDDRLLHERKALNEEDEKIELKDSAFAKIESECGSKSEPN